MVTSFEDYMLEMSLMSRHDLTPLRAATNLRRKRVPRVPVELHK
jgi:hypothetical protein